MIVRDQELIQSSGMSRPSLNSLRPYLTRATPSLRPELARAYLSVHQRSLQHVAAERYVGPHDVEKQRRIEQLKNIKALGDYHPRLKVSRTTKRFSPREFHAKYERITENQTDVVSVFGIITVMVSGRQSDSVRKDTISTSA